jgi:predicted outer membrane protein
MLKKLLLAGLLCATLALAQGGGYSGKKSGSGGDMGSQMGGPPSSNRFENIATALSLNKDQRKTVRGILDDGAKEAAPLRDQIGKSRVVVGEAIIQNKGEDELKAVAKTSSDFSVQLTQVEIKAFAKVYGTLDDTQKKDMRALGRVLTMMNGMYHNKNWLEE